MNTYSIYTCEQHSIQLVHGGDVLQLDLVELHISPTTGPLQQLLREMLR